MAKTLAPSIDDQQCLYSLEYRPDHKPAQGEDLVPPRKYHIKRCGGPFDYSVRIFDIGHDARLPTESESKEALKYGEDEEALAEDEEEPSNLVAAFYVESVKGGFILYDGPGPFKKDRESKRVMDIKGEALFGTTSTYTEVSDGKSATMYKEKDKHWWNVGRSVEDFDGKKYQWKNSVLDDLTFVRDDGVVIAAFHRSKLSIRDVGILDVKEPVTKSFLYLLLSTHFVKWKEDHQRRIRRSAGGAGGGGGV